MANRIKCLEKSEKLRDDYIEVYEKIKRKPSNESGLWSTYTELVEQHFRLREDYAKSTYSKYKIDLDIEYDMGIFMVGFSMVPVILSLYSLTVKNVVFICSKDTNNEVKQIQHIIKGISEEYIDQDKKEKILDAEVIQLKDASKPEEAFKHVEKKVQDAKNQNSKIAVDITCGKKTMMGGSFTCALAYTNIDIYYMDYEEYDEENPLPGTEFIIKLPNPYTVFKYGEVKAVKTLMNQCRYANALERVNEVIEGFDNDSTYIEDKKEIFQKMQKVLEFYSLWDEYKYEKAFIENYQGLGIVDADLFEKFKGLGEFINKCASFNEVNEKDIYKEINGIRDMSKNVIKELSTSKDILKLVLIDRYINAQRKKQCENYMDYILRLSSVVELGTYAYILQNVSKIKDKNKNRIKDEDIFLIVFDQLKSVSLRIKFVKYGIFSFNNGDGTLILETKIQHMSYRILKQLTETRNQLATVHGTVSTDAIQQVLSCTRDFDQVIKKFIIQILDMDEKNCEFEALEGKLRFKSFEELFPNLNIS